MNIVSKNKWKYTFILGISSLVLVIMVSSYYMSDRMTNTYSPLIDAAMEIKLEATTAHLWFEEILSGDRSEDLDEIFYHIDQSAWYANAMLQGGKNPEGTYRPLEDEVLRKEIVTVLDKLNAFKKLTRKRAETLDSADAGNAIDQQYDHLFRSFIRSADNVETLLQQKIQRDAQLFRFHQASLTAIVFLLSCLALFVQIRYDLADEKTQRLLLEASHFKDDFIAAASHELRTPLATLEGYSELLRDHSELSDTAKQEYHSRMAEQIDVLSHRVDELFDLDRMESGHLMQIERAPARIFDIAMKALQQFQNGNHACQLLLHFEDEQQELEVDENKILQVLENLIGNAIKYSPEGGLIEIRGRRNGEHFVVTVSDQGLGMTSEQQQHVFEKYYRARPESTAKGLGVGLYLVKHIVESHGGTVKAESRPGKGSTFTLTLPLTACVS